MDRNKQFADALKDNAWFVGFAPRKNPEIVVVALLENGEHGDRAAPIVRDLIKAYVDKKTAKATQKQFAEFVREMRGTFALFDMPIPFFGPLN